MIDDPSVPMSGEVIDVTPHPDGEASLRVGVMTNSLIRLEELPLSDSGVSLTASDAERIATVIEAELAASTRATCDCAWRKWGPLAPGPGHQPAPAPPEALAASLAERAEAGLTFGTLDGYCSALPTVTTRRDSPTRRQTSSSDGYVAGCGGSGASHRANRPTR
ncbi:hypothetical protein GCM10011584_04240 [Nocardioides phosphati]|uniref:DUF222 domain-containing protein n=1 Tax=Nocardioides phosphati TaxID=1867775 RepID=A0ABQ2N5B3_9ACTN|nr:hypothetical protein [Nocardioides phosphati]GGO85102.1 hypothetical protein GCM10011584_04240 [Nocardioides phosphati]